MDERLTNGRLPDPLREIARLKKQINPKCAVAKSKYVDIIISMRMQGVAHHKIEKWLNDQGPEHRIPASTIFRNTRNMEIDLPLAEEMAQRWGGRIDVDLGRELAGQMLAQRNRIDSLQRAEAQAQKGNPRYLDRRIRVERELLMFIIKDMYAMLKNPLEAAMEALQADGLVAVEMTDDGKKLLEQMLIDGDLKIGSRELTTTH
jgi:hypothetical protein